MSYDDDGSDHRAKSIVYELIEELIAARNRFRDEEFASGSASSDAYARFCARIVQTADFLAAFDDEDAVDEEEFEAFAAAVEQIKSRRGQHVTVEVPAAGDTSAMQSTPEEVPAILSLDPEWLIGVSKQAERICKDLGWGPTVKTNTATDEGDLSDLQELLRSRGQTDAADRVPVRGDE